MAFSNPITGGQGALVRPAIKSPNYVMGQIGWSINRDGSAEFNDVVVRGTVIAADFQSSNYVAGVSGFDLDGVTNQIEINTGFRIGGAIGNHIAATVTGGASEINFFSGAPDETVGGVVFAEPNPTTPAEGRIAIQSPTTNNGTTSLQMLGGHGTNIARAVFSTNGVTPATGLNGVGAFGIRSTDVWTVEILNEQSVKTAAPPLILGNNTASPQSRLFVSANELLSVDGTGLPETFYLNETSDGSSFGPVSCIYARPQSSSLTGGSGLTTTGTGFAAGSTDIAVTGRCPASGLLTITIDTEINNSVNAAYSIMSFEVRKTGGTGTVWIAGSDDNSVAYAAAAANASNRNTGSITRVVNLISAGASPSNPYFVRLLFRVTGGTGTFIRPSITVTPSL